MKLILSVNKLLHSMKRAGEKSLFLKTIGIFLCSGIMTCDTYKPTPIEPDELYFPAAPVEVVAKIGNGIVVLTWQIEDSNSIKEYRIYRRALDEVNFHRIGRTARKQYLDESVVNGMSYDYEIAAVNKAGKEGKHSRTISVIPAIYSIILDGGASCTNNRGVKITVTAPANTMLVNFSNDSTFRETNWETYATARDWQLSPGDGMKTVYAKFRNVENQELTEPVTANIILDTIAAIEFIEEDSDGRKLQSGDTLHIRLKANEINGSATAEIYDPVYPEQKRGDITIRLYDDGTMGDTIADDGSYETEYVIDQGIEVENAFLFGYFTDVCNNVAPRLAASGRLKINNEPVPVILFEPNIVAGEVPALSLKWTPNTEVDFALYQLMRAETNIVTLSATLIAELHNAQTTFFVDAGLDPAARYYYRVYVFDTSGNKSGSNIVTGLTVPNEPPGPIILSRPVQDSLALVLSWTPATETDFAHYRLFRSTTAPVDTLVAPLRVINESNIVEYRDRSVTPNVDYYYRIFVYDRYGLASGSNEVSGRVKL